MDQDLQQAAFAALKQGIAITEPKKSQNQHLRGKALEAVDADVLVDEGPEKTVEQHIECGTISVGTMDFSAD